MTEEQVTKAILIWLEENGWEIISFDFPQSGTGISLHLNEDIRTTKNKGAFIPDIIAIKNKVVIFFENKNRFVIEDFLKVERLRQTSDYTDSTKKLLKAFSYKEIFYGVGLPFSDSNKQKTLDNIGMIDFSVFVSEDKSISIQHQIISIFQ